MARVALALLAASMALASSSNDVVLPCASNLEDDSDHEACFGWCDATQLDSHCKYCKVAMRACMRPTTHALLSLDRLVYPLACGRSVAVAAGAPRALRLLRRSLASRCQAHRRRSAARMQRMMWLIRIASHSATRTNGATTARCASAKRASSAPAARRSRTIPMSACASHGARQTTSMITARAASVKLASSAHWGRLAWPADPMTVTMRRASLSVRWNLLAPTARCASARRADFAMRPHPTRRSPGRPALQASKATWDMKCASRSATQRLARSIAACASAEAATSVRAHPRMQMTRQWRCASPGAAPKSTIHTATGARARAASSVVWAAKSAKATF